MCCDGGERGKDNNKGQISGSMLRGKYRMPEERLTDIFKRNCSDPPLIGFFKFLGLSHIGFLGCLPPGKQDREGSLPEAAT